MSSSVHINITGEIPTQELDDTTLTAEAIQSKRLWNKRWCNVFR